MYDCIAIIIQTLMCNKLISRFDFEYFASFTYTLVWILDLNLKQTTSHTQIKDHAAAAVLKDLGSCIEISIPGFATDPALQAQAPPKIMTRAKTATRATTPTVIRAIPQYRTQGQEGRVRKKCIIYTICTYPILSHTVAQKSNYRERDTSITERERERE